jgi:hypothetical protein
VLIATAAGILATLAAYGLAATGRTHLATAWPLLSLPAAITMTLAAAGWQLRTVTADALMPAVKRSSRPASRPRQCTARATTRVVTRLRQAWWRTGLALLVIVVACATFGLELAVRWLFGGVIVGSWLGFAVSWQVDTVDRTAVIVILMLATITMTDIGWRNGGERSAELRTLRAIGWPARGVARLAAGDALLLGLAGGVLASALDVAVIAAIVHRLSPSLALVAVAAIGLGVTLSLITVSLSAAVERAIGALA